MKVSFTVEEIAQFVEAKSRRGATDATVRGIASLEAAEAGDLSFLGSAKYRPQVAGSRASLLLLPPDYDGEPAANQCFLLVENPSVALARVCARIETLLWPRPQAGIHATAVVDPSARVAESATIGPLCVVEAEAEIGERVHLQAQVLVGRGARVGDDTWLQPGAVLTAQCELGRRVRLHPGVVVGSDGFGYEFVGGRHEKVPQVGIVVVGDDVEIGANSTIDRARFSRTVIGEGTKIDNLVQVAHNVTIGRHCILCAQVGISGSATIEDYVILAGQAGVAGHLTIGQGAKVGGQSGVTSSVEAGAYVIGNPSMPFYLDRRLHVLHRRLPELFQRMQDLESRTEKTSAG